uniref:RING-type domain-containing protein n=2 Tax=Cryptophlebia leucotreta granulosis virus TaxID=35254 RepID=A0A2H4ZK91_GVCL|nr:hypothetical protein [Cryptophlebia leucotreta granulovirus]
MARTCQCCRMPYPLESVGHSTPFVMIDCGHYFCKKCINTMSRCFVCTRYFSLPLLVKNRVTYKLTNKSMARYSKIDNSKKLNRSDVQKLERFILATCFTGSLNTTNCTCVQDCDGYICNSTNTSQVDQTIIKSMQRNNKLLTSSQLHSLPSYYRKDLENFLCLTPVYKNYQLYDFLFMTLKSAIDLKHITNFDEDKLILRTILDLFEHKNDATKSNSTVTQYINNLKSLKVTQDNEVVVEEQSVETIMVMDDQVDLTGEDPVPRDNLTDEEVSDVIMDPVPEEIETVMDSDDDDDVIVVDPVPKAVILCEVCLDTHTLDSNSSSLPMVVTECGHMTCFSCIKELYTSGGPGFKTSVECPQCDVTVNNPVYMSKGKVFNMLTNEIGSYNPKQFNVLYEFVNSEIKN